LATGSTPAPSTDPLRLKQRLGLQGAGFALVLLGTFAAAVYGGIAAQRQEDLRGELRQLAASAASQLPLIAHEAHEVGNARKFPNDRAVVALPQRNPQRLQWFDAEGRLLNDQGQLALPPLPAATAAASHRAKGDPPPQAIWQRWPSGLSLWQPVYTQPRQRTGSAPRPGAGSDGPAQFSGSVRVALSNQAALDDLHRLQRGLLLGAIVAVLSALVVGRRMVQAAFAPLQQQVEALQRFSGDASHELRHPLTNLRTLLAAAPDSQDPASRRLLAQVDRLAVQMAALLNDLLYLARLDQGLEPGLSQTQRWRRFDLLELLDDLLQNHQLQAAQKAIVLALEAPAGMDSLLITAEPEPLQRLFTNLLLNALRHSPCQGRVTVRVRLAGSRLVVEVVDGGPGIAAADRERIFERFWRGPSAPAPGPGEGQASRSSESASPNAGPPEPHPQDPMGPEPSGLGLAIARAIARHQGGDLQLVGADPGHCVFAVDLPLG
jgi:signal transduction histidine kinase